MSARIATSSPASSAFATSLASSPACGITFANISMLVCLAASLLASHAPANVPTLLPAREPTHVDISMSASIADLIIAHGPAASSTRGSTQMLLRIPLLAPYCNACLRSRLNTAHLHLSTTPLA